MYVSYPLDLSHLKSLQHLENALRIILIKPRHRVSEFSMPTRGSGRSHLQPQSVKLSGIYDMGVLPIGLYPPHLFAAMPCI